MQSIVPNAWRHAYEGIGRGLHDKWNRLSQKTSSLLKRRSDKEGTSREQSKSLLGPWSVDAGVGRSRWWNGLGSKVEVTENKEEVRVKALMPGLEKDAFKVDVDGRLLTLRAEQKQEEERRDRTFYYRSRSFGSYLRTIPLPSEVDASRAKAKYRRGELVISLPKVAVASSRRIEIAD